MNQVEMMKMDRNEIDAFKERLEEVKETIKNGSLTSSEKIEGGE